LYLSACLELGAGNKILNPMKSFRFLSFWLLLTVGMATVVFNSCKEEKPSNNEGNKPVVVDPDNPNNPYDPNNNFIAVIDITLDTASLTLSIGDTHAFGWTITPANATDPNLKFTSSDLDKVSFHDNGSNMIVATAVGEVTITATAGNQIAKCVVTVVDPYYDEGVVINGVRWATRNGYSPSPGLPGRFVAKPEEYRMKKQGVTAFEACPEGYRLPTLEEIELLCDTYKVSSEWTTLNGVNGRRFTDKSTNASIFLPAAGATYYNYYPICEVGTCGRYWSSTISTFCMGFNFHTLNFTTGYSGASTCTEAQDYCSIRPVVKD
jgi:uncharacterized protein (TIGR02145 family)